jgi:hypothetical protein
MFTNIHALCVAALSLVMSTVISTPTRTQDIELETGVFCDTQKQMERYVAVFDGDMQRAINAVNSEEKDPTACVYGTIATARNKNETYHIVRVIVVGFMTHSGFRASAPAASFSAEKIDERVA